MNSRGQVPSPVVPRVLPALLLASGFCGISYEILYAKLLGNLLGDRFAISAAVLLTFLAGIGIGTLLAHRFVRWLWAIEAGIGLCAVIMVLGYESLEGLIYARVPAVGTSLGACVAVSVALLIVPAFLVGCSLPLFAAYLSRLQSTHVFSTTYAIYNFGAALTALTMEFMLLRVIGLRAATLSLAALNFAIAAGLIGLSRLAPLVPVAPGASRRFPPRDVSALAIASVASAIFQLMMIKVGEFIFGPYNETFSLVLATVLLGIAVGAIVAGRWGLTFRGALLLAMSGLVLLLGGIGVAVTGYAALYQSAVESRLALAALKFSLTLLLMGLPAVGFGATLPALLATHRDVARESGWLLFVSSMGNVCGFLLMAFALHRYLDYGPLLLGVVGLGALACGVHCGVRSRGAAAAAVLLVLAVGAERLSWDEALLYYGHTEFHSASELRRAREIRFEAERFKGPQDVFAITQRDGNPYFFINGYVSIPLNSASEKIVGALSSMFSPRTDRALVLGVGSGATAGTVGLIFDHTDAVEINRVVLDHLHLMSQYNFDIERQSRVSIHHDDGIHFLKTATERYSLILNTVTTPLYFSSSKLYTRDFLADVTARLTPDGVYTTWVDRKIGDRGIDIILATLDEAFDECWLTYLKSSYFLMACSNDEVRVRSLDRVTGVGELRAYLAERHQLSVDMIPYSILSTRAASLASGEQIHVNTMDFPVLEHEMARLGGQSRLFGLGERMIDALDLEDVGAKVRRDAAWEPAGFVLWAEQRLDGETLLGETLRRVVERQYARQELEPGYNRLVLEQAEAIGSAEAWNQAGHRLFDHGTCSVAIEALERAVSLDPEVASPHYYLGRCFEKQGDVGRARAAYAEALRLDPEDDEVARALKRVSDGTS